MYQERLWPAAWVWALSLGVVAMLAWAMGFALGPLWGIAILAGGGVLVVCFVALTVPKVTVDDTSLVAGWAHVPRSSVANARALDSASMERAVRHPSVPTYLLVRPWAARSGVLIELADADDPHGAWLITSRRPQDLAAAILTQRPGGPA